MIVDVHAHYYPKRYLEQVGRLDVARADGAPLARQSINERLDLLDRSGIDTQVLSVSQVQPYLPGRDDAADAAKLANLGLSPE